jgi:hypothetical protein
MAQNDGSGREVGQCPLSQNARSQTAQEHPRAADQGWQRRAVVSPAASVRRWRVGCLLAAIGQIPMTAHKFGMRRLGAGHRRVAPVMKKAMTDG